MDMKNTLILLIFLLSVLGLIIGVQCTPDESSYIAQSNEKISLESGNPSTTNIFEQKTPNFIDQILNPK